MTELTDKIRSKGFWDVAILPQPYDPNRYQYDTLGAVLARATVRMRGWPVPFWWWTAVKMTRRAAPNPWRPLSPMAMR